MWYHGSSTASDIEEVHHLNNCLYCHTTLERDTSEERALREAPPFRLLARAVGYSGMSYDVSAAVCPCCGWWKFTRKYGTDAPSSAFMEYDGAVGLLKTLDLADLRSPLADAERYLAAHYEERYKTHPRLFESLIASIFRQLGYESRVTAYSNDGGIDIFLDGPGDSLIGVQVKRYRNVIKAEQIRALTGALTLQGVTAGIFVTTSNFQKGAQLAADQSGRRGIPIQLVDSDALFDALRLARVSSYQKATYEYPWLPYKCDLAAKAEQDAAWWRQQKDESMAEDPGNELLRLSFEIHEQEDMLLAAKLRRAKLE